MTDRINTITVVLERPTRDDDCEAILNSIRMIKGVSRVQPNVADGEAYMAISRAQDDLGKRIIDVIYPKNSSG